jgi:chemotaxis signal transduction protein
MTPRAHSGERSLVLFPIRRRRFALPVEVLRELAPPVRLHKFPHSSQLIVGVIIRRGRIIPVYDAGTLLADRPSTTHRFYLIVQRHADETGELAAIPVDGECELVNAPVEVSPDPQKYIYGTAMVGGEWVHVLDVALLLGWPSAEKVEQTVVGALS